MPELQSNYSEFFTVDESYYPEINPDSIKGDIDGWMKTWPHPTFIELLEKTERMLAREARGKKHCIWVQGAFGTGKSRVIWTVEELLRCSEEKFNAYFNEFPMLRAKPDLREKLLSHKRGKIVTAFRYSSGDISNTRKLIIAIYESVSDALKKAGYDNLGTRTIRGMIAEWLEDEGKQQIFQIMLDKPQYRSKGSFSGKTPRDILAQLRSSSNVDQLINDILDLSENERIGVYDLTMADLKEWLTDIIDTNGLTALVLLWDEFSSYFKQNLNTLDQLQSLVELCANKPFEMIIVTHEIGALDRNGENTQLSNIVKDRFEVVSIEMPDNVAFDLIGHAMKPNVAAHDTWELYLDDIAGRSPESRMAVSRQVGVGDDVLRRMTPIHPMAALMLKYISERFASNQRSMFNFIKSDETEDLHAFQWFINTHTPENPDILTMDYLWDFFYEKGRDEHGTGAGRSNLDILISGVLDTYPQNESRLNAEQRRVLKVVLMMQAISRRINNAIPLLRPTEANVKLAFEGDDSFSTSPVLILKNQLVTQLKILFASEAENHLVEYATATVQGDQPKIDEIIARIKNETRTGKLVSDAKLSEALKLNDAEAMRFQFTPVTIDDFTRITNRLADQVATPNLDFHIYGVICFVRDEAEQTRMHSLIADARREENKRRIVMIDASGVPMGAARFAEWAKYAGNEEYWRPKDPDLADNHKRNLTSVLTAWKDAVETENLLVYYGEHFDRASGAVRTIRDEILPRIVLDRYPLSFDNAAVSGNFFHEDKFQDGAKKGIRRETGGIFQQRDVTGMLQQVWTVPEYWKQPSLRSLPISVLKQQLTEMIDARFTTDVRISHSEIYDFLAERGFMPCNLYAFLTGFLLREYAQAPYRYSIGESGDDGDTQNSDKLGEHVGECFKYKNPNQGIRNYKEKYIEIMSREQKAFVDFVHDAFDVAENSSVERAASRMRTKLKELGYPVWCYTYVDQRNLGTYLERIAEIANDRGSGNVPSQAKRFGKMLLDVQASSSQLMELLTTENGAEGLHIFLEEFRDGELLHLAEEIGTPNALEDVRNALSSGEALWLWSQETGEEEISKLIVQYQIVAASNKFAGYSTFDATHDYSSCITKWKECAKYTHIPSLVIQEKAPELRTWVQLLRDIIADGDFATADKKQQFLTVLTEKHSEIRDFLNNRSTRFTEYFSTSLQGLDADAGKRIYAGLDQTSFTKSKSDFVREVNEAADWERASLRATQLRIKWNALSGFDNAHQWSEHYSTPILALVPASEHQQAKRLFTTLKAVSPSDADITASLAYLDGNPTFVAKLKDQSAIDAAFVREMIGQYHTLVTVDEARQAIRSTVPSDPYEWVTGNVAKSAVKEKADHNYLSGANQQLLDRMSKTFIYADHAATTRLSDKAFEAMLPWLKEEYGNPSQPYSFSRKPKMALAEARKTIASCIGAQPEEIIFTSGGTESDNWAIKGMALSHGRGSALLVSAFEHHAVLRACAAIVADGWPVMYIAPSQDGIIEPDALQTHLVDGTKMVSVMMANNEVGTIQPIQQLAKLAHEHGAVFHTDAVQAVGHIPVDVHEMEVDLLSASAHKFNGPKGVGFLYIRNGTKVNPYQNGGGQEGGMRAGTENVAGIVGMATALQEHCESMEAETQYLNSLTEELLHKIIDIPHILHGENSDRLPGLLSLAFPGFDGEALLHRLDLMGIAVSTGSACNSKETVISHVLQRMKIPEEIARSTIRISISGENTLTDVDSMASALHQILKE